MKLPKSFTTVTPFSKGVALLMYFIFPIIGFQLGLIYQKSITPQYHINPVPARLPIETDQDLIERCGKLPRAAVKDYGRFSVKKGPVWSPDCRHIAWSVWMSGTGGSDVQAATVGGDEGVYVYTDSSGTARKIYTPTEPGMTTEFLRWKDRDMLLFQTSQGEQTYSLSK